MKNQKQQMELEVEAMVKPNRNDMKKDIIVMNKDEIRFLVDYYYQKQDDRKTKFNQLRAVSDGSDIGEQNSNTALHWLATNMKREEEEIKKMLDVWTDSTPVGRWMKEIIGIGPVITAGIMSYFDISKAQHPARFYSYAGLNTYNNPWLGKEKATKLANNIYSQIKTEMVEEEKELKELCGKSFERIQKSMIRLSKEFIKPGDIEVLFMVIRDDEDLEVTDKQKKAIDSFTSISSHSDVIEHFEDIIDIDGFTLFEALCHYFNNPNIVSGYTRKLVCNKTNRNISVVDNGLRVTHMPPPNKKDAKPKKPTHYIKSDLIKYLSKPPYNSQLKTLCWKIGDSIVKRSNFEFSLYGRLYKERKALETYRNERGMFAEQAKRELETKNFEKKDVIAIYESGRLTPSHIDNRARRWVEQIFITHVFEIMYMDFYKKAPPKIYALANEDKLALKQEHADYIPPEIPYAMYIDVPEEYYQNYPEAKIQLEEYKKRKGIK